MQTDTYYVLGNPVAHSRSPWIHARFANLVQHNLHYDKRCIPLTEFNTAIQSLIDQGICGCNITVPFKLDAFKLAQHTSARAQLAQAANLLHFRADGIYADNTDGAGLVADIVQHAGITLADKQVLLIGAGGAAAGALGALISAGAKHINVANRSPEKAHALVQRHQAIAHLHATQLTATGLDYFSQNFDIVINATASSLNGATIPVPSNVLRPGTLALDMMYGEAAQHFLNWAQQHGAVPRDGLGMLVEQAAESFWIWRGIRPPTAPVLAELRALVDAH